MGIITTGIVVLTTAYFIRKVFKKSSDDEKKFANQIMRYSLIQTTHGMGMWVKRDDTYEMVYNDTLLVVRKRKSGKEGFKIRGYYKSKVMFTGVRMGKENIFFLYHWGEKYNEACSELLSSKELYQGVMKIIEREDTREQKEILRRLTNRKTTSAVDSMKKHLDALKQKEDVHSIEKTDKEKLTPSNSEKQLPNPFATKKHLDVLKEKEESKRVNMLNARENFKRKVRALKGEDEPKQTTKIEIYLQLLKLLKEKMDVLQQEELLTDEEKHLLSYTYPNDMDELVEIYEELDENSKAEMHGRLVDAIEKVMQKVEIIQQEVEQRKLKRFAVKMEVIKSR